jgi:hypothetical protein
MKTLKIALLGAALLSTAAIFAAAAPEGNGNVNSASYAAPEGNGAVNTASYATPEGNGSVNTASLEPEGHSQA